MWESPDKAIPESNATQNHTTKGRRAGGWEIRCAKPNVQKHAGAMQLRFSFWLKRPASAANFLLSQKGDGGRTTDMQQNLLQGNNACPHDNKSRA